MRSLPLILPPAAVLFCATAGAATTACTVETGCHAAQRLFSDYRYDRTAPLDAAAAPASSDVMVSPIGVSLNAASVFSSSVNRGNGDIPPARFAQRRPEPEAPAGFGPGETSADVLNGVHLGSVTGLSPDVASSRVPFAEFTDMPESAVAAWHRGRALGVSRFKAVGPRLSAPNGATGGPAPSLDGSDTPSTIATPEPMTLLLIGSGLVIFGALARRRSAAHS